MTAVLLALVLHGASAPAQATSTLAVRDGEAARVFWRSDAHVARWAAADPAVTRALHWSPAGEGIERGFLRLEGGGETWRTGVTVLRIDPRRQRPRLVSRRRPDGSKTSWSVADAGEEADVAFNGGHFAGGRPWGWLVSAGQEMQPPGAGPLSSALVQVRDGRMRVVAAPGIAAARAAGDVVFALQSYPTLLAGDGEVPPQLQHEGQGVHLDHHDSRLTACELRDGRVLVALTRFEGLGGVLSEIPFGPTLPEMAAIMGALGCARAVALDGGISGQLLLRDASARGGVTRWPGLRRVPVGVEWVRSRTHETLQQIGRQP